MAHLVRLRVALANQPGALARVATVIAGAGGNITALDVHHSEGGAAVDDIVVEFPAVPDLTALRDELAGPGSATLVSHQETRPADPVVGCLRRVVALIDSGWVDPASALAEGVAEMCSSPVVWVSDSDDAVRYEAGRFALERHGAVVLPSAELPAHLAERLPGDVCLLAVPDPETLRSGRVVFVARPAGSDFTATEVARIEALTVLHTRVERLVWMRAGRADPTGRAG